MKIKDIAAAYAYDKYVDYLIQIGDYSRDPYEEKAAWEVYEEAYAKKIEELSNETNEFLNEGKKPYVKVSYMNDSNKVVYWPYPEVQEFCLLPIKEDSIVWLSNEELKALNKD